MAEETVSRAEEDLIPADANASALMRKLSYFHSIHPASDWTVVPAVVSFTRYDGTSHSCSDFVSLLFLVFFY